MHRHQPQKGAAGLAQYWFLGFLGSRSDPQVHRRDHTPRCPFVSPFPPTYRLAHSRTVRKAFFGIFRISCSIALRHHEHGCVRDSPKQTRLEDRRITGGACRSNTGICRRHTLALALFEAKHPQSIAHRPPPAAITRFQPTDKKERDDCVRHSTALQNPSVESVVAGRSVLEAVPQSLAFYGLPQFQFHSLINARCQCPWLRQWPAAPMVPMHAPSACKRRQPRVDHRGPRVAGVLAFGWANQKSSSRPIIAVLAKAHPSPPIPSPAHLWGGFHGAALVGPGSFPSVPSPQQSRLQCKHFFAVITHIFSPRGGAHPLHSAPVAWPAPPEPAPFSSFPSHDHTTQPSTTQHHPRRHIARLPRRAFGSQSRPDAPDPSPVSSLGPLQHATQTTLRLWPPWRLLCGRAASKCEMRRKLACMGRE